MKLPSLTNVFRRVGIDMGTTRTRIWHDQLGFVVDEPTCLAVDERVKKVVAVGKDAAAMKGRVPAHIKIYYPLREGVIDEPKITEAFLRMMLQKVIPRSYFFKPIVMASVPAVADEIDRQAVVDTLYAIGAREVYLIQQPLAAAIGADVPIADASGSFVLHLGGGVVEGGIISFGSLVASESSTMAGLELDQRIKQFLQEDKSLIISDEVAEQLKKELGSLSGVKQTAATGEAGKLISGRDVAESAPKEVTVDAQSIKTALLPAGDIYREVMKRLLEKIAPELTVDVIDKGMLLTGGMAQLDGLDTYLIKQLGVSVSVVEDPDQAVIKGIATALKYLDLFKESLGYA